VLSIKVIDANITCIFMTKTSSTISLFMAPQLDGYTTVLLHLHTLIKISCSITVRPPPLPNI